MIGVTLLGGLLFLGSLLLWMAGGLQSPRHFSVSSEVRPGAPPPPAAPSTLTVVTWNIAWGYGWGSEGSGHYREAAHFEQALQAMGDLLRDLHPDLVLLQEVDFDSTRSHHVDQALVLADRAGLPYLARAESWTAGWVPFPYWPIRDHFGGMHSGGAILSRFPISDHQVELFAKPAENPPWYNLFYLFRYLESAELTLGDRRLSVFNTHLEAFKTANRVEQAKAVAQTLRGADNPLLIFGGDLNAVPPESPQKKNYPDEPGTDHEGDPTIELLRSVPGLSDSVGTSTMSQRPQAFFSFPSHAPNRKLDHLFVGRGLKVLEARVVTEAGTRSDHLPLLIRVQID